LRAEFFAVAFVAIEDAAHFFMLFLYAILFLSIFFLCVVLWNVLAWKKITESKSKLKNAVSVLIPARNEETNLASCLDAVLSQGNILAEVLVYDDHSIDKTPNIIADYTNRNTLVRLITANDLPTGWCGKNFACAQLAEAASGEWMLFIDADARLSENAIARMIKEAVSRQITFLSCWPSLELCGFWEKTLMPMLNFVVFTLYPAPLSLKRDDASLGLAHGACLLVHRQTYESIGGHGLVRDEIFEDTRLAQLWREKGHRGLCLDGQDVVCVRMYNSFGEIWSGFQKNFFPAFKRESGFWFFIIFHFTIFLLPFILALLSFKFTWMKPALLVALCVLLMRLALAIRFRQALWSVLLHPLSETVLIVLGISSCWKCKSGHGVEWKGRLYKTSVQKVERD
jgi:chlorobactene glucosyltransferase